jgi:hypothetical protein
MAAQAAPTPTAQNGNRKSAKSPSHHFACPSVGSGGATNLPLGMVSSRDGAGEAAGIADAAIA